MVENLDFHIYILKRVVDEHHTSHKMAFRRNFLETLSTAHCRNNWAFRHKDKWIIENRAAWSNFRCATAQFWKTMTVSTLKNMEI